MTKRRRERDRPKAAQNALYNPNKRILLNYEADEEVDDQGRDGGGPIARHEVVKDTATVHAPLGDVEYASESESHSSAHRHLFEEAWDDEETEQVKDDNSPVANDSSLWSRGARRNDTTGQWTAIGSLAYQWEDENEEKEVYDSEEEEAMSYLRQVRSERQSMPTVFKAPRTYSHDEIYENGDGDTRGYFEDGAYVARGNIGQELPESAKEDVDPQEAFTRILTERFLKQREEMRIPPDLDALQSLDDEHPISFPAKSDEASAKWLTLTKVSAPQRNQVRAMRHPEVCRLLELIKTHYLARETEITSNVSAWIWSLFAKLDDVGAMSNNQVWSIRELGRKAILVQLSFSDPATAEQLERIASEESTEGHQAEVPTLGLHVESHQETATLRSLAGAASSGQTSEALKQDDEEHSKTRHNTLATLDMIIVLAGEVFGQRDLLEFRRPWNNQADG